MNKKKNENNVWKYILLYVLGIITYLLIKK